LVQHRSFTTPTKTKTALHRPLKDNLRLRCGSGSLDQHITSFGRHGKRQLKIPCSKRQGIFDRKVCGLFYDSRFKLKYHSAMADCINDTPAFYAGGGSGLSRGFRENEKNGP
jgi:hypothetical protein